MPQFFNTISEVSRNYKKYDDWEQAQSDLEAKKSYLNKEMPLDKVELQKLKQKAETITRVTEIMDARSEDNSQDVEAITGVVAGTGLLAATIPLQIWAAKSVLKTNDVKVALKNNIKGSLIVMGTTLVLGIAGILWGNSKTKEASRLGRYQAKIHDLQDAKNFVQFTPEQIAQAEEIAKSMPDITKRNSLMQSIHNVMEMMKDNAAYKAHKKELASKNTTQSTSQNLSPEQLKQAKADKEVLLSIIKKINNTAEDYTENTENAFDTITMTSFLATIPLGFGLNKLFNALKLNIPKKWVSLGIAGVFPIAVALWSLAAEKKASRVGRYKARQEIQNNPEILRSYSDEELKKAENIKGKEVKKGFFERIVDNFKFIGTYIKDKREYDKYNKEIYSKKEKLNKALLKVNVSDEQLKEAKHLQDKTFMSFEKMDEMSQRYSEDMEAASEIGKQVASSACSLGFLGASAWFGWAVWKGKFPWHRVIKLLSNLTLKKTSGLRMYVDKAYDIISKNKELKKAFNKTLSPSHTDEALKILKNNSELKNLGLVINLDAIPKNPNELISKFMKGWKDTIKDTFFAKWFRKMLAEGTLAYYRLQGKINKKALPVINLLMGKGANSSFYQTYKTLINTSAICAIPVLGVVIGLPYAFCAWLTNIQKKSGKIGIMQAMKSLDNNALYVNPDLQPQASVAQNKTQTSQTDTGDMLASFINNAKLKRKQAV